jgi:hypothetical protein
VGQLGALNNFDSNVLFKEQNNMLGSQKVFNFIEKIKSKSKISN